MKFFEHCLKSTFFQIGIIVFSSRTVNYIKKEKNNAASIKYTLEIVFLKQTFYDDLHLYLKWFVGKLNIGGKWVKVSSSDTFN